MKRTFYSLLLVTVFFSFVPSKAQGANGIEQAKRSAQVKELTQINPEDSVIVGYNTANMRAVSLNQYFPTVKNPFVAIKTNLLYDATTTLNLGLEFRLSRKLTLEIPVNYNPFSYKNTKVYQADATDSNNDVLYPYKKIKHFLIQPELRFWPCESFSGHFFGIHAHYAEFNAGYVKLPFSLFERLETNRYEGKLYGAGISYGYQKVLSNRFSIEGTIGVGYAYMDYDVCSFCQQESANGQITKKAKKKDYFGPTKAGISLIYFIK